MIMTKDFRIEATLLKKRVREKLKEALEHLPERISSFAQNKCVLSGGCFASLLTGHLVNDWDLWCLDDADIPEMLRLLDSYTKEEADEVPVENPAYMNQFVDGKIVTANAVTLKNRVQFIKLTNFATAKKSFDFEHCRVSYIPATDTLYMSKMQFDSIINKKLIPTGDTKLVAGSRRMEKFYGRGWSL